MSSFIEMSVKKLGPSGIMHCVSRRRRKVDILQPMFGMIVLTGVVALLLYGSRMLLIYRVTRSGGDLARAKYADEARPHLPGSFRNITDNYNHLFEQPTLFYAVVVYIFLVGHTDSTHVMLAWAFVGFRVAHSLVQVTSNWVPLRITCFGLSGASLLSMVAREGVLLL